MSEIVLVIRDRECNQCCTVAVYGVVGGRFPAIQGVTGGTDQTSGECSLGHTIPI